MLETERLILRPHRLDDLQALHAMDTDAEARLFCGGVADLATTRAYLEYAIAEFGQGRLWKFAIDLKTGPAAVGWCWLKWCEPLDGFEIGYQIGRPFWKQGIATEAAQCVTNYAFAEQKMERVYFVIDPQNTASCRVAEKLKLSLEREQAWDSQSGKVFLYLATAPPIAEATR
jgi:[ribosomal protein S5]-alanine N-acetyltransferase